MAEESKEEVKIAEESKEEVKIVDVEIKSKRDLTNLTERRKFFQEHLELFPEFMQEMFLKTTSRDIAEGSKVSNFVYHFANDPTTRHEAHWQFHSYVLMETLQTLKEIKELLVERPKNSGELKRRKT